MTTTVNGSSCSISLNPTTEIFFYCLILVFSLVGNSFIGIVVFKTQKLRKPINYFIVNMAISDLLFTIFWLPKELTQLYVENQWLTSSPVGQALCKLVHFITDVSTDVSIQSLVLIAVDRFGAVVFPLRSPLISSKLCPFFILATWIVAMAAASPSLVATKLVKHVHGKLSCFMQWDEWFVNYILAIFVVFLYIPVALLVVLYSFIVVKLKTQKIPGEQSVIAEQQRAKRNRNVLKMAIAIVVGFVLCWVPWSIIFLLSLFGRDLPCSISLYFFITLIFFMGLSNCAINPCICFVFSDNYRQGLKRLLKSFNTVQDRVN